VLAPPVLQGLSRAGSDASAASGRPLLPYEQDSGSIPGTPSAVSIAADGRAASTLSILGGGGVSGGMMLPHPAAQTSSGAVSDSGGAPRRRSLFSAIPRLKPSPAGAAEGSSTAATTSRTNYFAAIPQMGASVGRALKKTLSGTPSLLTRLPLE